MAASAKFLSIFFLVSLFSVAVHARDSQFFSKVTHDNTVNKDSELNNNNNNNVVKNTQLPTKEESLNNQEPESTFVPETQNSYGLYGHETGQLPPSQTSNYASYVTTASGYKEPYEFQQQYMDDTKYRDNSYVPNQDNNYYNGKDRFSGSRYATKAYENNYYTGDDEYNKNVYQNDNQQQNFHYNNQGMKDSRLTSMNENGYNTMSNQNENMFKNGQRQGMSDTRFLANGRYFYDINTKKYVPIPNEYENNSEYSNRNNYYGNDNMKYYDNNKSMEGYQNQEEEFQSQDEFQP